MPRQNFSTRRSFYPPIFKSNIITDAFMSGHFYLFIFSSAARDDDGNLGRVIKLPLAE